MTPELTLVPQHPEYLTHTALIAMDLKGVLSDWEFLGDGDQITAEMEALDWLAENPGCKVAELTYTLTSTKDVTSELTEA